MLAAMAENSSTPRDTSEIFADLLELQGLAAQQIFGSLLNGAEAAEQDSLAPWADASRKVQDMWLEFQDQQVLPDQLPPLLSEPAQWIEYIEAFYRQMPLANPEKQQEFWQQGVALWEDVLGEYGIGSKARKHPDKDPELPLKDKRFADPRWREQPVFALIHQTYLMIAGKLLASVDEAEGLDDHGREQLRFATRTMLDALCPANFPLINPVVLEKTIEQHGANLVKGMERLAADLDKGRLTHTDESSFELGKNIATTPGKVVHETPLYQLIQYSPVTDEVMEIPLVIFPPWINRFYILDLNPKKSFVRWTVEQGITTFIVSWKSADESMAGITWDDYIRAQIDAIDHIRQRLKVPAVHAIGYCVAGTTLAATLAILARRGEDEQGQERDLLYRASRLRESRRSPALHRQCADRNDSAGEPEWLSRRALYGGDFQSAARPGVDLELRDQQLSAG